MVALSGFNWFLIVLCVVVALLMIVVAVYTLLHYQHPEDRNQVRSSPQSHLPFPFTNPLQ